MLYLLDKSVLQLSVTALFYLEDSRKIHLQDMRARRSQDAKRRASTPACKGERERERERERESASFGSSFYMFLAPGPVLCRLGQPGVSFVLPEVLTPVLSPRTFLCSIFVGFSLPYLLATTILDSFPYSNYLIRAFSVL